ncbi:MAG: HIT domain-containing protein [Rickettsiales bacterium]|jgi:diadenosine tetraphosphate (Ap4A) HIT family hydrolase|nr:HIT domain-containing protein [Rickettsiales bacterium]
MYDKNNIFAKIIRGEIPCKKISETIHTMAFDDLRPQARIHILVIPKGGYENLPDFVENATEAEKKDFWNMVISIADKADVRGNFRMVANTGVGAGQSVQHFHVHVMSGDL